MKYLITGLGNPGPQYAHTRHNIGYDILDALAEAHNATFTPGRYGDIAHIRVKNKILILLKPTTFMNLSGNAVRYWMNKEKLPLSNLLVVVDDLALPFGTIRLRQGGSDAGHNGLKNIAEQLGNQNYPRLRFGIGNDFARGQQIDYVLGQFTSEQQSQMSERIEVADKAIEAYALSGLQFAMTNFNNK